MKNAFYMILNKLSEEVGMIAEFDAAALKITIALVVMALLLCFFGIKLFKAVSSIMMFVLVALLTLFIMKRASMGEIVTAFTVLGMLAAAVTYRWHRLSAVIISIFIGFSLMVPIVDSFWVSLVFGIILGITANFFPVITVMVLTAVWGGIYFAHGGMEILSINLPVYLIVIISILAALAGIAMQYVLCRNLLNLPLRERRLAVYK